MDKRPDISELPPEPSHQLLAVRGNWISGLFPIGLLLAGTALALSILAPNALWFLLLPGLIIGAIALMSGAVALLLRHF